jgi:hypothetical protein
MGLQSYGSYSNAFREIYRVKGIRGFYEGYVAGLATSLPYSATFFLTYELLKKRIARLTQLETTRNPPYYVAMGSACLSGGIAAFATCPFDVVKTRLQVQGGGSFYDEPYKGFVHAFKKIYQEEGIRGFFKGAIPRITTVVPAVTISMGTCKL